MLTTKVFLFSKCIFFVDLISHDDEDERLNFLECYGIKQLPDENEDWFCKMCIYTKEVWFPFILSIISFLSYYTLINVRPYFL